MKLLTGTLVAMLAGLAARDAPVPTRVFPLQGTWTLVAADKVLPDGETTRDYGENPKGRLVVDVQGRYSLQIFKSERPHFASDSKADGSVDEFRSAVMGSSTHYGTMKIDERAGVLVFSIEGASFPNWEGTTQRRQYQLDGAELRYKVPPRADGSIPVSVWHRLK
ncbi:lipocalin-like domain-containing protein [Montanilutibacter psychrotolerans]|uniref:Lipocalin-like domain protein n=1 Tax=Montanilutibacter psychrotolerans TaxID=1327343 RepID=A0A3M8T3B5_9GAMM|nr:lipocalin-like domain-containing protein [Lysobacter psychrotolerans]RNF86226.1 lipocalin-like domain protein [Lysobacter psychrotolerans]